MSLADGEVFAGYTIMRRLGSGGMGEVYLAQHPRLPRLDAIKILPVAYTSDNDFRNRFNREADVASRLWHPHIVTIHDRGEFNGQLWISMDYVDGTDAAALVRDRYPRGMPLEDALEIVSAVAGALDYAHNEGLLHRDVKPANILLAQQKSGEKRILLADFGVARRLDEVSGLTATNMTVGSVAYAAPEQLTGAGVDGRTDQYALACTAFHLLTGVPPFQDSNPAVLIGRHLTAPPPRIGTIRPELAGLDHAFDVALSKDRHNRFARCQDFARTLATCAQSGVVTELSPAAPPTMAASAFPIPGPVQPPESRRSTSRLVVAVLAGALATLLLAAAVVTGVLLTRPDDATSTAGPATSSVVPTASNPVEEQTTTTTTTATTTTTRTSTTTARPANDADLDLSKPISVPACDGTGIVVLGNATNPATYREEVQGYLNRWPDASYLRTDYSCPSLRQVDDNGNKIYAVYRIAGKTRPEVCAAVAAAGGNAYGKWLDTTSNPRSQIQC
ncbi:MAG: serine/threonine-protein kinase [Candidatus Sericytochromatia bacterium]